MLRALFGLLLFVSPLHAETITGASAGGGGGSGTVTSITAGCGSSTGGSAITTTGTIAAVEPVDLETGSNFAIPNSDCGYLVNLSNGSAQTPTIAQAGTGGNFAAGWFADVCNIGAGTQTLTPATSTIGGNASQALTKGQCVRVVSDGTNYQLAATVGDIQNAASATAAISMTGQVPQANGGASWSTLFAAGNYYQSWFAGGAGATASSGFVCLAPTYISQPITISSIGFYITTAYSGSGNGFAVGLYASGTGANANKPSGAPLGGSTFSTATGTGATSLSFASNYSVIAPGWYWLAFEFGDATQKINAIATPGSAGGWLPALFIGGTLAQVQGEGVYGYSYSGSGGTLPTITPASLSLITTQNVSCSLAIGVASVP